MGRLRLDAMPRRGVPAMPRRGVPAMPRCGVSANRNVPLAARVYGASGAAASVAIETRMSRAEAVDATAARSLTSASASA